jgi:hypothetical protein
MEHQGPVDHLLSWPRCHRHQIFRHGVTLVATECRLFHSHRCGDMLAGALCPTCPPYLWRSHTAVAPGSRAIHPAHECQPAPRSQTRGQRGRIAATTGADQASPGRALWRHQGKEGEKWGGGDEGLGFPPSHLAGATRERREEELPQIKVDVLYMIDRLVGYRCDSVTPYLIGRSTLCICMKPKSLN